MKSKKRRESESPEETHCTYYVAMQDWKPRYSFSLAHGYESRPGPYSEHASIEGQGVLLSPKKFEGRVLELYISGDRDLPLILMKPSNVGDKPLGVGSIFLRGDQSQFFGSVPFDALSVIISSLYGGGIKYLVLHGFKLHYGQATITSMSFEKEVDPD